IKYAEKAIELGRKGHESGALAHNAKAIALMKLGKTDEAIKDVEEFLRNFSSDVEAGPVPNLCLNVAVACIAEKKPEEAYKWALEALKYIQLTDNSHHNKALVERALLQIVSQYDPQEIDLNHDSALH